MGIKASKTAGAFIKGWEVEDRAPSRFSEQASPWHVHGIKRDSYRFRRSQTALLLLLLLILLLLLLLWGVERRTVPGVVVVLETQIDKNIDSEVGDEHRRG